jgi:hypothetical protein
MRTAKKMLSLIIPLIFIMSCTEYDRPEPELSDYRELSISATLSSESGRIVEGSLFSFSGTTNCNLADNTCVTISGVAEDLQYGNYVVKNGTLRIMAEDTGCYLTGDFQGCGKNFFNGCTNMNGSVSVECGTGIFEADAGKLELRITGVDTNGNYFVEINGNLQRQKKI